MFITLCVTDHGLLLSTMDVDHSSAFDVMDTDKDRFDMNLETSDVTAAAVTATPTVIAAAPTAATTSGKIRHCPCGRGMISLSYDHHSICSFCRGFDCTIDNWCEECLLISDEQFQLYFKHQKYLKSKVLSRQCSRSRLRSADTPLPPVNDPVVTQSPSSVVCDDSDGANSDVSHVVDHSSNVTLVQLQDLLGNFTKNLESRFSDINNKIDNLSQDVDNRSLAAPSAVAGRAEPTPDKPSLAPYSDGLEGNLGGPVASEAPTGVDSPTQIEFGVFLARVRGVSTRLFTRFFFNFFAR